MSHSASTLPSGNRVAWTPLARSGVDHGDIANATAPSAAPEREGLLPDPSKLQVKTAVVRASSTTPSDEKRPAGYGKWLPYALRPLFLGMAAAFAMALSVALAVMCWYSSKNNGLGSDDGSASLRLAWRYLPTIIAVLFTLSITAIYDDVRRTIPFARLAHPTLVDTEHTLFYKPKAWFTAFSEGFSRKHKAGGGVLLVVSSLATGLTVLSLSTLTSSLLVTRQVVVPSSADLQRFATANDGRIELLPRRDTFFHTTSGYVYNATTSMWVTNSHVVLPFNVKDSGNPTGSLPNGIWEAETKVLQMESTCVPMSLKGFDTINITYTYETDNMTFTYSSTLLDPKKPLVNMTRNETLEGFILESEDGCSISTYVLEDYDLQRGGGLTWSNMSSSYISWQKYADDAKGELPVHSTQRWSPLWDAFLYDFSKECLDRNLLFATSPWGGSKSDEYWANFTTRAELCTPTYYEAMLPVNASISNTARAVTFDEDEFARLRRPVGKDVLDTEQIELLSFKGLTPNSSSLANIFSKPPQTAGLTEVLLSSGKFNFTSFLYDEGLAAQTSRLRSRFFNELIMSSVTEQQTPVLESVTGRSLDLERRIVVVTEIAISLSVLLFVLTCYLLGLIRAVSVQRRPLNLSTDPATTIGLATYLNNNEELVSRSSLDVHTSRERPDATSQLHGTLTAYDPSYVERSMEQESIASTSKLSSLSNDWRPKSLRTLSLGGLTIAFGMLAAALLVLRNFASRGKLYQSAFVFQVDVEVFKTAISPFTLLATLIAVGLALWWDAMEKNMRLLQPYLSMAKRPRIVRRGTGLSYQSSYWVGAAAKAASNGDWLLSLVTIGTTLSQVLVIAMAAIFERQPGVFTQSVSTNHLFTDRVTPLSYQSSGLSINKLMLSVTGDWMYSALDQLVLGAPQPPWTSDGWVLSPVDLQSLPVDTKRQQRTGLGTQKSDASLLSSGSNVTLKTTAVRARLECETVPISGNTWLTDEVKAMVEGPAGIIKNLTAEHLNLTGALLPQRLFENTTYDTTVLATSKRVLCCLNETENSGSAVAYWSEGYAVTNSSRLVDEDSPSNFSIKWIVGPATTSTMTIYTNNQPSVFTPLQFEEVPAIQMLECKPVIEQAQARVTVARSSGQVMDFKLLEEPRPRSDAWGKRFDVDQSTGENKKRQRTQDIKPGTNYTTNLSFGTYFMAQLLTAADNGQIENGAGAPTIDFEDLYDQRYNIRDTSLGVNMDFGSYANYVSVNKDPQALLNAEVLLEHSQKTFGTFFQHFAASAKWIDGEPVAYRTADQANNKQVDVITTERIEILTMAGSAVWLCLAIIFILMLILITLAITLRLVYPPTVMKQKMECLADMLALIAGSEELLAHVQGKSEQELSRSGIRTRLGWFRDRIGVVRWGVEIEDAVEFFERPGHRVVSK